MRTAEPHAIDNALLAGRYRPVQALKQRPGEKTFLGEDLDQGGRVVIKTLALEGISADARQRLSHEADVLRRLELPSYRLLAQAEEDGWLYIVATFVEGQTLEERLLASPLTLEEALAVGRCLLEGLATVHAAGVLHRDVKPANVVVAQGAFLERATLIDFGLASSDRLQRSIHDIPVGTARYVSPEQAGLLNAPVDRRADLYAAGVVLFECVAGRPPFLGGDAGELLRQQVATAAPELRSLGVTAPAALEQIIARLLRKDPAERYQSADAALSDLAAVERALRHGEAEPAVVVGSHDRRSTLAEPVFVGRFDGLQGLNGALQRAISGAGGLAVLRGAPGMGKTRLMAEWAPFAALQTAWVLRGQADRAPARPFGLLEGIAEELAARAAGDDQLALTMQKQLAPHRESLCLALPELTSVLGPLRSSVPLGPDEHGTLRAAGALTALLRLLGRLGQPVVLLLDDCQWADEQSLASIGGWRRCARKEEQRLLVVASLRSEAAVPPPLAEPDQSIALESLGDVEVRQLVESMAGKVPGEALALVTTLAEGSPFMAIATLWGLVESGALVGEASRWRVDAEAMNEVRSSHRAAALLTTRMRQLPGATLRLLRAGAILGTTFELAAAAALAETSTNAALEALQVAHRRHLLWAGRGQGQFRFVHHRLREVLLEEIEPRRRRALHLRAAEHLDREGDDERQLEVAYHFDAAGASHRGVRPALAAAHDARQRYALDVAEQQLEIAERGTRDASDRQTRLEVLEALGDVLTLRDAHDLAREQLGAALALCRGPVDRARVRGKQGRIAFRAGDTEAASRFTVEALHLLRRRVPQSRLALARELGLELVTQASHVIRPPAGGKSPAELAGQISANAEYEATLLATRLHVQLAHIWWWNRGVLPAIWTHLGQLNLAERLPASSELGLAYAQHALVLGSLPRLGAATRYLERSHQICRDVGAPWGIGHALGVHGIVLSQASRAAEAIAKLDQAAPLIERSGDRWELLSIAATRGYATYLLGDLNSAREQARVVHEQAAALRHPFLVAAAVELWARATGGRVPRAVVETAIESRHGELEPGRGGMLLQAKGICLLRDGDPVAAAETFERGWSLVKRFRIEPSFGLPGWQATALRLAAPQLGERATRRRARRAARQARRIGQRFGNHLPHALRELGLLAALDGRLARARRHLDDSLAVAERLDMRYERAQTLLVRGEIGRRLGWTDAVATSQEARRSLEAMGIDFAAGEVVEPAGGGPTATSPLSFSLADRYERVLEEGHSIATALSPGAVFAAVRRAALTLLRGDECLVLRLEGTDYRLVAGEDRSVFSRTLADRTLATGTPEVGLCGETAEASPSESMLLGGVRSALAAPIRRRSHARYCLYIAHRQVGGLFGPDELRIAGFIASLAAAALENASNYRQLAGRAISAHEKERVEIARELHDGVGQLLAVIKMEADWLGSHASDPQEVRRVADNICSKVDETLAGVRDLSHALRPRVLDDLGISCALETLVSEMARHSEIAFDVEIQEAEFVPGDVATALYRIAQEALANMLRHGEASACRVAFRRRPPSVVLEVEHDGRVVTEAALETGRSMGVASMRERASLLDGELTIAPRVGGGTRLTARIPCGVPTALDIEEAAGAP